MSPRPAWKKGTLILAMVALPILALGALQLTLRLLFSDQTLTAWTVRVVEENLGLDATLDDVRLHVVPYPVVHILGLTLRDPATGVPWVQGESLEIALKWRPMLQGRFLPREAVLHSPHIRIETRDRRTWTVLGRSVSGRDRTGSSTLATLAALEIPSVSIRNGSVDLFDPSRPQAPARRIVQEVDAVVRKPATSGPLHIQVQGQFPHRFLEGNAVSLRVRIFPPHADSREPRSRAEGDLLLSNLPPDVATPMLREMLGAELLAGPIDLTAHLSWDDVSDFDLSGELRLRNYRIAFPRHYSEPFAGKRAQLTYDLSHEDGVMSIKHAALTVDGMSLWGEGVWTADLHGAPWYSVALHGSNLTVADVQRYLPEHLAQKEILRHLRGAGASGSFDVPLLEVTDTLPGVNGAPASPRTVHMKILFRDFALRPEPSGLPLEEVNGRVAFQAGTLRFEGLQGRIGRSRIHRLHGTAHWPGDGPLDLTLKGRLHLPEIQQLLRKLPALDGSTPLLSGVEARGGYAAVEGRLVTPDVKEQPPSLEGRVALLGADLRLPFWNTELSAVQGRLSFKDDRVLPFTLKARIQTAPVTIGGKVSGLSDRAPSLNLTLSAAPSEKEWRGLFPDVTETLTFEGPLPQFSMHLLGTPQAGRIEASLDLSQTAVTFATWLDTPRDVKNRVHLIGEYGEGEELRIRKAAWETEGATLSASGSLTGGPVPVLTLTAHSDHLLLAPFARMLPKVSADTPEASVKGRITASHAFGRKGSLTVHGKLTLTGAGFTPAFRVKGVRHVAGTLDFTGGGIEATGLRVQWGDDPATVDFKVADLHKPEPDFTIRTSFVDLKQLFSKLAVTGETARSEAFGSRFRRTRARGEIMATQARYAPFNMQDFRASVALAEGVLDIPTCSARSLDGVQKGRARVVFDAPGGPHFEATVDITGVDAEEYLHLFPHNRTFYTGTINGSISVKGPLTADLRETARQMTGDAQLTIRPRRGRSNLDELFHTIRERLAIISGQRDELYRLLAFDKMGGDFTLKNGRFYSNNFYIDQYHKFDVSGFTLDKLTAAVPMRVKYNVKATGSWDFLDTRIDCYVIAHPFAAASKLVEKFPIAGKVLTGPDDSLFSQSFHFEGFTSYRYRGTEERAQLKRIAFAELPPPIQHDLKGP